MKNKLISLISLIVAAVVFFVSLAFLIHRIANSLVYLAIIFQLIATGLITVLCFFNVIYLFTSSDTDEISNDDTDK